MLAPRPLVSLAGGFVAGLAIPPHYGLAGLLALPFLHRARSPLLLALAGLGLGSLRAAVDPAPRPPAGLFERAFIEGVVEGPPSLYRSLDDPDHGIEQDGAFVVGPVQVRYYRTQVSLIGGERVRVWGRVKAPRPASNPGQFDAAALLRRRGIHAVLTLERLEVLEGPPWVSRLRESFRRLFDRHLRPDTAAFLASIVLGRREPMEDALRRDLQESGTAHLLAISGQNLVIVTGSVWALLTILGFGGRPLTLLLLALLGGYVLLVGFQISVIRSFLMIATLLGGDLLWRRRDPLSATALAALLLTAWDPREIRDIGFQLSFAAVLGLSLIAPIFHRASSGNPLRGAFAVSAAAWLATAPIVLRDFNLLTPGIVPANLLLVPLLTVEFVSGLAHLVLEPLGAGLLSGAVADGVFALVRGAASAVNALPFSHHYAPPAPPGLVAAYYAGLLAWVAWTRCSPAPWKPWLAALVALPLGFTAPLARRSLEAPHLAVLDVGRGSCAVLEWPDHRAVVVDCGSLDGHDVGASIAARYLWQRGITRLEALVLSHPDADHANGAASLLRLFPTADVLLTKAFPPDFPVGRARRVVVERTGPPFRHGDLEILGPPLLERLGRNAPANETSIVLRAAGVLIPGDVEERGIEELLALPDLKARWLILPHHGKFHARHEEFVRRVSPEAVFSSAPVGYGSDKVLEALPVPARLTGREGALEILLK
jgi:competence protein ComEC